MPKDTNLKQMLLKELLDDSLTKTEVLNAFKEVYKIIKELKKKNIADMDGYNKSLTANVENHKNITLSDIKGIKEEIRILVKTTLENVNKSHSGKLKEVDGIMANIRNGKDADEVKIIEAVIEKLEYPTEKSLKENMPTYGEPVRDGLELLQGDERLAKSAIRGLEKELKELRKLKETKLGGKGGGFSYMSMARHFVDDETPAGTVNGTNKIFTIAKTPNPTVSLKVYVNGQRMRAGGEDYTLSVRTITFITAPPTGAVLLCDYRF